MSLEHVVKAAANMADEIVGHDVLGPRQLIGIGSKVLARNEPGTLVALTQCSAVVQIDCTGGLIEVPLDNVRPI